MPCPSLACFRKQRKLTLTARPWDRNLATAALLFRSPSGVEKAAAIPTLVIVQGGLGFVTYFAMRDLFGDRKAHILVPIVLTLAAFAAGLITTLYLTEQSVKAIVKEIVAGSPSNKAMDVVNVTPSIVAPNIECVIIIICGKCLGVVCAWLGYG